MTLLFISSTELIVVVVLILVLFGGKKIPELMKGLGQGVKEFKDASKEAEKEDDNSNKS
ncbi:MAG: twin-arginine translocase TatA/TatE family subunit [Mangrovibacterium sp.]